MKKALATNWRRNGRNSRRHCASVASPPQRCVATTQTGGDPSYVEVLVCLQMGRDAGQIQRN
jgi:hypothetical protein